MTGHITLNGKEYMLVGDVRQSHQQQTYTPFATQVGSGKEYDDLQEWSAWVMQDWQAGTNQKDAKAGGYLFAEAETRFPERLMLPLNWTVASRNNNAIRMPGDGNSTGNPDTTITLAAGERAARRFTTGSNSDAILFGWFYIDSGTVGESVRIAIYSDSSGTPGTSQGTVDITIPESRRMWIGGGDRTGSFVSLSGSTNYWFVVDNTGSADIVLPAETGASNSKKYNGSWSNSAGIFFITDYYFWNPVQTHPGYTVPFSFFAFEDFNDTIYAAMNSYVAKLSSGVWTRNASGFGSAAIQDIVRFGDKLYVSTTRIEKTPGVFGTEFGYVDTSDTITDLSGSHDANHLYRWKGYLWRSDQNDLYYTADGSTWTGPLEVGSDDYEVRGMAGLGDVLYVSTDEALWGVFPGDAVIGIERWPMIDQNNGFNMKHWQGDLYIPLGTGLVRFTSNGQFIPMGLDQDEGLPQLRSGVVTALQPMVNWLLVYIAPDTSATPAGYPSVWAWNGEGWHHIHTLPEDTWAASMHYSWENKQLYVGWGNGGTSIIDMPDKAENPLKNTGLEYQPHAWIEFPKFYGGLNELQKDWESVYVDGENITSNRPVKVFWQDEDSTDWELLGTITSSSEELRWSNSSTRPNSRWIKLALQLTTTDRTETPIVEAVRVKFHPMITDLYRWNLTIEVGPNLQLLDGTKETRSASTLKSDIETVLESVPPVTFVDIDGTSYTVKAESGAFNYTRVWHDQNNAKQWEGVYRLTLRQVVA